jgi:hypothetical protein
MFDQSLLTKGNNFIRCVCSVSGAFPSGVVVVVVDIHDCLYVCIDDGDGPARSSSIRTRTPVAEVTGWRFTFPSWDPPNLSIRWETHRKRITAVSPTSTNRNTTTVRLKSNPTTPTPADCIACTTSNEEFFFLRQFVQPCLLKNPKYIFYTIKSSLKLAY